MKSGDTWKSPKYGKYMRKIYTVMKSEDTWRSLKADKFENNNIRCMLGKQWRSPKKVIRLLNIGYK